MSFARFTRLAVVATGFRGADSIIVAAVPLIAAAVFGAGPDLVGLIVAAQGSAWLIVSLPAGVLVDRLAPLAALRMATIGLACGISLACTGTIIGSLPLLAVGAFVASGSIVIGLLAEMASIQAIVPGSDLPRANGRIQLIQSIAVLVAPLTVGALVSAGFAPAALGLGIALAVVAIIVVRGFAVVPPPPAPRRNLGAEMLAGFAFVRREPVLIGIVLCSVCWNLAFFALAAQFVPYALTRLMLDPAEVGLAQAGQGVGSIVAAVIAAYVFRRFEPRLVLAFGPLGSTLAALILWQGGGIAAPFVTYFLLGFGPILWFICQNTIRQLVTPRGLLGRVGAVIQVAIYGVRPVGALAGGFVATRYGFDAGLALVTALFAASSASVFLTALIGLRSFPAARTE